MKPTDYLVIIQAPVEWINSHCVTCGRDLTIGFQRESDRPGPISEMCWFCLEAQWQRAKS